MADESTFGMPEIDWQGRAPTVYAEFTCAPPAMN
jgi:hypothetical protein